jgi:hypothetical protein
MMHIQLNNYFQLDDYLARCERLLHDPASRLCRIDHHSLGRTTYVLQTTRGLHKIEAKTVCMMEFARG